MIGKGFDALVFDYERVNQLDLLAANGTFLSQPMVRKAMVVIEVQIREYPRFRLFPRFRNGRFTLFQSLFGHSTVAYGLWKASLPRGDSRL